MPVCVYCHQRWSWWETMKRTFSFDLKGVACPYCKERQYTIVKSQRRYGKYSFIPFLFALLSLIGLPKVISLSLLAVS